MFRNSPTPSIFEQLGEIKSPELINSTKFIKETITTGNKLTTVESANELKLLEHACLFFLLFGGDTNLPEIQQLIRQ